MTHILFIDPLEKLDIKKDSTLLLAHTMKENGLQVRLLFEKDFSIQSDKALPLKLYDFKSSLVDGDFYVKEFKLTNSELQEPNGEWVFHMRLDPPFDQRYLKYLWMIDSLSRFGVKALNNPRGIMLFNEKIAPFSLGHSLKSYVGNSKEGFLDFCKELKASGSESVVLKPVDLYQGIGVEKVSLNDEEVLRDAFLRKTQEFEGSIMAQPYKVEVESGEIRTVLFNGKVIGTIRKIPKKGDFLANVARGATYEVIELDSKLKVICEDYAKELGKYGLYWLAFDLLAGKVGEVNVTCPGLLVEVSHAEERNLSLDIIQGLENIF